MLFLKDLEQELPAEKQIFKSFQSFFEFLELTNSHTHQIVPNNVVILKIILF